MVVHVPRDEHAIDLGAGLVVDDEIALLIDIEPVAECGGIGFISDRDKDAVDRHLAGHAGGGVAELDTLHLVLADDLLHRDIGMDLDLGVLEGPIDHDLAGLEGVAAMEQVDLGREAGEVRGLFERGIPTADHGDLPIPEEESVARRARRHAAPAQARLAFQAQPDSRRTRGHDD